MSGSTNAPLAPDWRFVNMRAGAAAMVATLVAYLLAAHLIPCCRTSRLVTVIAFGLPLVGLCMVVSHFHIFSASKYNERARTVAYWLARSTQIAGIGVTVAVTGRLLGILDREAGGYFRGAVIIGVCAIIAHYFAVSRSKLAPANSGCEQDPGS